MKPFQDIFEFEHAMGENCTMILLIIGAYTAFKSPNGVWMWSFHYGAYFGDLWLKSEHIDAIERGSIENKINELITQRVGALTIEALHGSN